MMRVADDLNFKLCVAGLAAVALFTGTASFAQEHREGTQTHGKGRVISDPAEIAALLAKCGIKLPAPGAAAAPKEPGQARTPVRTIHCNVKKDESGQLR